MPMYDFTEFLKLSSVLHYNLSASSLNRYRILKYILGGRRLDADPQTDTEHKHILMRGLEYLYGVYSTRRRRLGPMAVLHPLRATVLFARARSDLDRIDLLTILFHDVLEDISPLRYETGRWQEMEQFLFDLFDHLSVAEEERLIGDLLHLTRLGRESYYRYIGRLLNMSDRSPGLVQIKLADRLDNTLDMRIDLQDPLEGIDLFQDLFQVLFVMNYPGYSPPMEEAAATALNSARRLHQLFKNAVLLSLVRRHAPIPLREATDTLFNALSEASLKEAQRTFIHLAAYHCPKPADLRRLLLESMDYAISGRGDRVTHPGSQYLMDGLFSTYFDQADAKSLHQRLDALHAKKELMIQASIAFIVIFLSFHNDPAYYVKGITEAGMNPE